MTAAAASRQTKHGGQSNPDIENPCAACQSREPPPVNLLKTARLTEHIPPFNYATGQILIDHSRGGNCWPGEC